MLDFGVAQMRDATSERTATGTALGTPAYMSPEQAMGLVDQLDGRADLFSVGAMMHALITGHRINNGRTEQEALVMAATKPVPSVARLAPHLPIELIKVIDKALAWDRRNRFQDSREMQRGAHRADALAERRRRSRRGRRRVRSRSSRNLAPAPAPPPKRSSGAGAGAAKASTASMRAVAAPPPRRQQPQMAPHAGRRRADASRGSRAAAAAMQQPAYDPLVGYQPLVQAPQRAAGRRPRCRRPASASTSPTPIRACRRCAI